MDPDWIVELDENTQLFKGVEGEFNVDFDDMSWFSLKKDHADSYAFGRAQSSGKPTKTYVCTTKKKTATLKHIEP